VFNKYKIMFGKDGKEVAMLSQWMNIKDANVISVCRKNTCTFPIPVFGGDYGETTGRLRGDQGETMGRLWGDYGEIKGRLRVDQGEQNHKEL
jgi:hypothetical protein